MLSSERCWQRKLAKPGRLLGNAWCSDAKPYWPGGPEYSLGSVGRDVLLSGMALHGPAGVADLVGMVVKRATLTHYPVWTNGILRTITIAMDVGRLCVGLRMEGTAGDKNFPSHTAGCNLDYKSGNNTCRNRWPEKRH